jgi:hypothetical protein
MEQLALSCVRVGQVAVVHQHDAEGRVDVERLRLFLAVGIAGRRVAHLAHAQLPGQARMLRVRNTSRTMPLALCMKNLRPCVARHDAGGVLAAVLQQQQRVVESWLTIVCDELSAFQGPHKTKVEGGWLPMAMDQSAQPILIDRHRGQAPSHI